MSLETLPRSLTASRPEAAQVRADGGEATRRAVRGVAVGGVAQVAGKCVHFALNVVASLAIIRHLGPGGYGDYVYALTFGTLAGLLSELGLSKIAAREMARHHGSGDAVLGTTVVMRLALAVAASALGQSLLALLGVRPEIRIAVAVVSLMYVTDALLTVTTVFQVRLAMQYEALVSVVGQAVDTVLILVLVKMGFGLVPLLAAPVAGAAVGVGLAILLARRRFGARARFDRRLVPVLLREALPVGIALILAATYLKLDAILLALMRTRDEVGIYGAAYRPVEYLLLAATLLVMVLFPLLARSWGRDLTTFRAVYRRGGEALLSLVMPVPIIIALVGTPLLAVSFDSRFAAAAVPLTILTTTLVLMVLNAWQAFALLAAGRQRVAMGYDGAALVVNVAANLVLIPRYGYLGSAAAAALTTVVITICAAIAVRRLLAVSLDGRRLARLAAANLALALILYGLLRVGLVWWGAVALAGLAYPALLAAAGTITLRELRSLRASGTLEAAAAPGVT